ncbi:MAG: ABC transporter substrate-binding protein [Comamonadaceae bacterium]|nr:ABC transporter substrate-binding protein [Comamonadaceae bacterium]
MVKLGHVAPMTGPQRSPRQGQRERRRAWRSRKLNAAGLEDRRHEGQVRTDGRGRPGRSRSRAPSVAQKLVDAKVDGVIGHLNSGTTIPASKLYSDAGIPQISASATNPKLHAAGLQDRLPRDGQRRPAGQACSASSPTKLGAKNVAIIDDRTAYGAGPGRRGRARRPKAAGVEGRRARVHQRQGDRLQGHPDQDQGARSPIWSSTAAWTPQAGPMVKQMKRARHQGQVPRRRRRAARPSSSKLGGAACRRH